MKGIRLIAAAVSTLAVVSAGQRAHANNSVQFNSGPMKNLYVDLVFWGPTCMPGDPTNACFVQDPDPQVDERQAVMRYITGVASWLRGDAGPDGSTAPPGFEPAIHHYGPLGITPGMWLNDPMPIPSNYLQGIGTAQPDEDLFTPIVTLSQNGTLGPAFDFNSNVANWPGLPASSNRITLVVTKGTNVYRPSSHEVSPSNASGYHDSMNGNPYGAVMFGDWVTLSHEIIEAMSDPILRGGLVLGGENQTGWSEVIDTWSSHELADECEHASDWNPYVNGSAYAWITVNALYSAQGVSKPWASCMLSIPEQHAPMAATLEYGTMGVQPLMLFYVDPNGHVQALEWDHAGQPLTYGPIDYGQPSPTVKAVGKPSAVYTFTGGGEYVFVKGSDGDVWMKNSNSWTPLNGRIYGEPKAVVWNWNNTAWVHVFVLGLDDNLYGQGVLNGVPQGWGQIPSSTLFVSSPTAISRAADSLDVFAVGEDGQMKQTSYTQAAGSWTAPATVNWPDNPYYSTYVNPPFVTTPAVAALNSNTFEVIGSYAPWKGDPGMYVATWKGANTHPWLTWNRDGITAWTTWVTPFLDAMPKSLGMFSLQGTPAIVSSGNGRVDVFAVSRSGELWWFYSTDETVWYSVKTSGGSLVTNPAGVPNQPSPANVSPLIASGVTGDPVAISRAVNQVEVFYRTNRGTLGHMSFNETNQTWTSENVLPAALTSGFIYDPPTVGGPATQCQAAGVSMHCCPTGYVMVGADVNDNMFKCAPLTTSGGAPVGFGGPWSADMMSCPDGQAMIGLRADQGVLACVSLHTTVVNQRVDSSTKDAQQPLVHACDPGTPNAAMSGIDLWSHLLTCASTARIQ